MFDDSPRPGHLALQALREKAGDAVSFRILRDWAAQHRYGNVTTAQFITLAERDSGRNLHLRRLALPAGQADVLVGLSAVPNRRSLRFSRRRPRRRGWPPANG